MVSLVDFFLPFLPLERPHIEQLVGMRLAAASQQLVVKESCSLSYDASIITFLADKVRPS